MNGGANGDGSTRGGDNTLGVTGLVGGDGMVTGIDDFGIWMATDPPPPEGLGLGMNTGGGDLLFCRRLLRRERSPSRNF